MSNERRSKGLLLKTWDRCRSFGHGQRSPAATDVIVPSTEAMLRSRSADKCRVAPEGCFSVYVGPEKKRFVMKTEYANHPLFRNLLEEAEMEYGYATEGPLELPCEVDIFENVLWEMEQEEEFARPGCNMARFHLLSPSPTSAMFSFTPPRHAVLLHRS